MKTNYSEKTNSIGKFFLIIVTKWESCNLFLDGTSIFKLAGKFSRLSFSAYVLLALDSLTINYFLSSRLLTNKFTFLKTVRISNRINPPVIKMTAAFAVSSYLSKIKSETIILSRFKSILSKESCNNKYAMEKCFSNAGKKVLKLMPAGLAYDCGFV